MMSDPGHLMLLAVPNVSEGRDAAVLDAIGAAFAGAGARVLDRHADPDHHRAVFTLAGSPGRLAHGVLAGAREAVARIDLRRHDGLHPHVGAVDVAPVVFREAAQRGAACAEALVLGDLLGAELGLPVFLYGALAGGRTRAELRRGGPAELARRMGERELRPDFGPLAPHPSAGAALVAARPPLVAFNVELAAGHGVDEARAIAARIREGGEEGLPGVRAIGLGLAARGGVAQVSLNVEDPGAVPLAAVVAAVARHAAVAEAELVGLAPRAAFAGFPEDVPVRHPATIEDALHALDG
jgi:glutamate formiminotransferase